VWHTRGQNNSDSEQRQIAALHRRSQSAAAASWPADHFDATSFTHISIRPEEGIYTGGRILIDL